MAMALNKLFRLILIKKFHSSQINFKKIIPRKTKGSSSTQWLTRQLSDPYVEKSKILNFRCRSAFKLMEIDDKYKILTPGQVVVDCGAAPGSWTQVVVRKVNADGLVRDQLFGTVISIDKQHIYPVAGAITLGNADFTKEETQLKLTELLNGRKVNVVLSDMAPNASGVKEMDDENMLSLCYSALRFAVKTSEIGASFIVKSWQCCESKELETNISKFYKYVKVVKPPASRSDSAEIFFLARNFKGLKKV